MKDVVAFDVKFDKKCGNEVLTRHELSRGNLTDCFIEKLFELRKASHGHITENYLQKNNFLLNHTRKETNSFNEHSHELFRNKIFFSSDVEKIFLYADYKYDDFVSAMMMTGNFYINKRGDSVTMSNIHIHPKYNEHHDFLKEHMGQEVLKLNKIPSYIILAGSGEFTLKEHGNYKLTDEQGIVKIYEYQY